VFSFAGIRTKPAFYRRLGLFRGDQMVDRGDAPLVNPRFENSDSLRPVGTSGVVELECLPSYGSDTGRDLHPNRTFLVLGRTVTPDGVTVDSAPASRRWTLSTHDNN
jgi:hypothetical protein